MIVRNYFYSFMSENFPFYPNVDTKWNYIKSRYNRIYHNMTHLTKMFTEFESYIKNNDFVDYEVEYITKCMTLGIIFHDIDRNVYNSVQYVKQFYDELSSYPEFRYESFMDNVILEIFSTDYINSSMKTLLSDLDLSILGSSKDEYDDYICKMKKENVEWDINLRKEKIRNLLDDEIYCTNYFKDLYENRARINLENEYNSY